MNIIELVNEIKEKKIMNSKMEPTKLEDYLRTKLEVKSYVSFAEKRELCKQVLDASCNQVGSVVEVDSVSRYLLFTIAMIKKYTVLEFGNTDGLDPIDEYDLLCENDLLNPILEVIGTEYTTCNNLLNMMMADINANNNNIAAVVDKSAQRLLGILDNLGDVLAEKIEELDIDLSQIDIDKYKGLLEKFNK